MLLQFQETIVLKPILLLQEIKVANHLVLVGQVDMEREPLQMQLKTDGKITPQKAIKKTNTKKSKSSSLF